MSLAAQMAIFGLQWAVATCLVGSLLKAVSERGRGWRIGVSFVPLQRVKPGRTASFILLGVSAAIALAAVTLLHLAA